MYQCQSGGKLSTNFHGLSSIQISLQNKAPRDGPYGFPLELIRTNGFQISLKVLGLHRHRSIDCSSLVWAWPKKYLRLMRMMVAFFAGSGRFRTKTIVKKRLEFGGVGGVQGHKHRVFALRDSRGTSQNPAEPHRTLEETLV